MDTITNKDLKDMIEFLGNSPEIKGFDFKRFDYSDLSMSSHYNIEMAARKMCYHLCMLGYTSVITYEKMEDAAGSINLNNSLNIFINIDHKKNYNRFQLLAIIAHEMCHKFLYIHQIRYSGLYMKG